MTPVLILAAVALTLLCWPEIDCWIQRRRFNRLSERFNYLAPETTESEMERSRR